MLSPAEVQQRNMELFSRHAALGELLKKIESKINEATSKTMSVANAESVESLLAPMPPPMSEELRSDSINITGTVSPLEGRSAEPSRVAHSSAAESEKRSSGLTSRGVTPLPTTPDKPGRVSMTPLAKTIQILADSSSESDFEEQISRPKSDTDPKPSIQQPIPQINASRKASGTEKSESYPPTDYSNVDDATAAPTKVTLKSSEKTFNFNLPSDSEGESEWVKSPNKASNKGKGNLFGRSFNALDDDEESFTFE